MKIFKKGGSGSCNIKCKITTTGKSIMSKMERIIWSSIYCAANDQCYFINTEGVITTRENINLPHEYYHSTNGRIYVLLKTIHGNENYFPLDEILVWTFKKEEVKMYCPKYRIIHINGNLSDNSIENLHVEEDVEEWVDMIKPEGIRLNRYEISTWGRIRDKITGAFKHIQRNSDKDGYLTYNLTFDVYTTKSPYKNEKIHRLIAMHFVNNPDPENYNVVNHINGNKFDNRISNLEWIDSATNSTFASKTGLYLTNDRIITEEIDYAIEQLLAYNGNTKFTYASIDHNIHPRLSIVVLNGIKAKKLQYIRNDSKYDLMNIEFVTDHTRISTEEVDMVIELLLENDSSVDKVYSLIDKNAHSGLSRYTIAEIKNKNPLYIRKDGKYDLNKIEFKTRPKNRITSDDVDYAIDMLLKYGSATEVMKHIDKEKYPYLTLSVIKMIKYKENTYVKLAKRYDLNQVEFKSYREN